MREKWNNLNQREQFLLAFTLPLISLYLLYCLLISPLNSFIAQRSKSLQEKKQTLILMQQAQQQQARQALKQLSSNQLLVAMATELNNKNTLKNFPHHLQQSSQGEMQLSFKEVPYLIFIEWLWDFSHRYAINIKQLQIEETPTPGVVSLSATIH